MTPLCCHKLQKPPSQTLPPTSYSTSIVTNYLKRTCFRKKYYWYRMTNFAQNYDISTVNAKKSLLDGIGHVAGVVDNNRLMVDQKCQEVLLSLDQYQWDPNPNLMKEKPKHNRASHMADAIRYALYSFETSMTGF